MNEDQLIRLAVRYGLGRSLAPIGLHTGKVFVTDAGYRTGELLAFAKAVAAAEREACAITCDKQAELQSDTGAEDCCIRQAWRCATDIRARSNND